MFPCEGYEARGRTSPRAGRQRRRPPHALACIVLLSALALAGSASAQTLTRAPELLEFQEAEYPEEAKARRIVGDVLLEVDIGEDGSVLDARVVQPAGHGFDEAALEAVRRFRFSPAEFDGVPTAVTIEYRYSFTLAPEPEPELEERAGVVNFRGRVLQRGTRQPVVGATVDLADGAVIVVTDEDGRFEAEDVPVGEVPVIVQEPGYEIFRTKERVEEGKLTEVVYYPIKKPSSPYESVVIGQREKKEVATVKLSVEEINRIPGTQGDTVRVVQNLPGVARSPFGSGLLVVRGGNPQDTRTFIDGFEVPLIFHFGALTSVYSSDMIEEVLFEPGNYGVRYGRGTAGRVELITRNPRKGPLHLIADVDLFDATALVEGPITEDLSVAFAARRSYVDAVINAATAAAPDAFGDVGFAVAPRYYDYQGKIAWQVDERNELKLDLFGSDDALALVGIDSGGVEATDALSTSTAFTRVALTWNHRVDEDTRLLLSASPGYTRSGFAMSPLRFSMEEYQVQTRAELYHRLSSTLQLGTGLDLYYGQIAVRAQLPHQTPPGQIPPADFTDQLGVLDTDVSATSPGLWTELIYQPIEGLKLMPGIRYDYDSFSESSWFDPRFNARWTLSDETTLKGGAGLYHQAPMPQNVVEEFGNPDLHEEGAAQYMLGIEQRLGGPITADLQLYYKDLFDTVEESNRIVVRDGREVRERYANSGTGKAYGAELLLRYNPDGRFFGWIAYSLSHVERDEGDNGEEDGASSWNQPHNLVAVGSLELPEIWQGLSFGFRARYTTGAPRWRSGPGVYDVDADDYRSTPMPRSTDDRLPDFFQLDLRVDKRWLFDESSFTVYLDVQNVTNRENSEGSNYNYDFSRYAYTPGMPIFPSIGLRYEY